MPRHPGCLTNADARVRREIVHVGKVLDTRIVVVLTREECLVPFGWMRIRQGVCVSVPATVAQVETTNASVVVVNNDDLLVVRPELNRVFGTDVVGMAHHGNVFVQTFKIVLGA
jgi:hypothetical protein